MILVFSVFPTIASAILALSRVKLRAGAYSITFSGLANFNKQLFGSEQFHFLGNLAAIAPFGWAVWSPGAGCSCGGCPGTCAAQSGCLVLLAV